MPPYFHCPGDPTIANPALGPPNNLRQVMMEETIGGHQTGPQNPEDNNPNHPQRDNLNSAAAHCSLVRHSLANL
jgi:hypothetical protein